MSSRKSRSRRSTRKSRSHKSRGRRSPRKSRSRKSRLSPRKSKGKCREYLQKKISKNIKEYKSGRYSSRAQAVAVSYSQVNKKYPSCKRVLSRK